MLKKLQIKFVTLVMCVVALILGAVFVSIGVMTYQQAWERLSSDMNVSIEASADAMAEPQVLAPGDPGPFAPDGQAGDLASRGSRAKDGSAMMEPPQLGRRPEDRLGTPVAVYTLNEGALAASLRTGAVIDDEVLESLTEAAVAAPLDQLRTCQQGMVMLKREVRGTTFVAFANDSALESIRSLVATFAIVGIGALAVFFMISIVFSRWALRPVQQAWDQQRTFIANASHELKTPLAIIKANTEIMLDEPDEDQATRVKWLVSTKGSAEGMEGLIDDMLALASIDERAEKGEQVQTEPVEPVDLSRLAEGQVLQFESRAFEGGFQLVPHIQDDLMAQTDADAVAHLLQILLDNACKYVDEDGTVEVRAEREGAGHVRFSVSNTGKAIPPEKLEHIFERFYRIDEAHSERGGHGLGLAIAHGLSDRLGAELTVSSTPERTCFTFVV